ncbi:hypothetical protein K437DRAFT_266751 [Tilletiaria anomala UBC 951]|uniref:SEC7 domain-containing protein n=1 Tax=Tilletiaria anomala (strain ATCC 24038 / CBS 436.72 / UBC 951) TaxID=1037660 RepID=A0A066WEK9_TILAU|nr:uncharacterized protein K437DRAFT_266751 [Tilletiaria anomala UBC 951]KDN52206.1 hypothetical protein K437DRAFT_266751 [Tilletiaria anomala UBC 951]
MHSPSIHSRAESPPSTSVPSKASSFKLSSRKSIFRRRPRTGGSEASPAPDFASSHSHAHSHSTERTYAAESPVLHGASPFGGLGVDMGEGSNMGHAQRPKFKRTQTGSSHASSGKSEAHSAAAAAAAVTKEPQLLRSTTPTASQAQLLQANPSSDLRLMNLQRHADQPPLPLPAPKAPTLSRGPSFRQARGPEYGYNGRTRSNSMVSLGSVGGAQSQSAGGERMNASGYGGPVLEMSKLDSAGGAAGLFGGGGGGVTRQRTSSLIPSLPFLGSPRIRTLSNGANSGSFPTAGPVPTPLLPSSHAFAPISSSSSSSSVQQTSAAMSNAVAAITARDTVLQNALRRASAASKFTAPLATPEPILLARGNLPLTTSSASSSTPSLALVSASASASALAASPTPSSTPVSGRISLDPNSPVMTRTTLPPSAEEGAPPPAISVASAPSGRLEPYEDESPDEFMQRAAHSLEKSELAVALASHAVPFYLEALQACMRRFQFAGNALDIALRKLLMELCLPKETQQIDRVMEAFAIRYNECNEGLFASPDQPYILAFSLMMLHTDHFNKNAKQKMSKADYVRNASSSEAPIEVLEYLYDNLIFTQFIFVDGDKRIGIRRPSESSTGSRLASLTSGGSSSNRNKIDAYGIITQGRTHELTPNIGDIIQEDSPFSLGIDYSTFDTEMLRRAFSNAPTIEIVTPPRSGIPIGAAWSGNAQGNPAMMSYVMEQSEAIVTLKVTKVGVLNRKDDPIEGSGKKHAKKWKQWGLILTSAQLLFFKDTIWTSALQSQIADQVGDAQVHGDPIKVNITPRITYFRPDGVLSLGDAIAVLDESTACLPNAFRLYAEQAGQSRQYLVQASSHEEMVDWMTKINYCAAFRSVGIRRLDIFLSDERVQMMRTELFNSSISGSSASILSSDSSASSQQASGKFDDLLRESNVQIQRRLRERAEQVAPKVGLLDNTLRALHRELEEHLRLARHFHIMTPFQKSTRERIEAAVVPLATKVRRLRLEAFKAHNRGIILAKECDHYRRLSDTSTPVIPLSTDDLSARAQEPMIPKKETEDRLSVPGSDAAAGLRINTFPSSSRQRPLAEEFTPTLRSSQESDEKTGRRGETSDFPSDSPTTPARPGLPCQTSDGGPPLTPIWSLKSPTSSAATMTPVTESPIDSLTDSGSVGNLSSSSVTPSNLASIEEAADWHATAAAQEKRVSLAALPTISADDVETLTRVHKNGRRSQQRSTIDKDLFTPPNFSMNDPGPFA